MLDSMSKAYSVAGMANQLRTQQGMQDAYRNNSGPDGQLNQAGFLSDLGKVNPQAAIQMQNTLAESGKIQSEAQTAKMNADVAVGKVVYPALKDFMENVPEDQKSTVFDSYVQNLKAKGVPMSVLKQVPMTSDGKALYEPDMMKHMYAQYSNYNDSLGGELTRAEIREKQSQTGKNFAETEKTKSETIKQNPALAGQTNDPAKLVPSMVPKEHQAQALKEIEAAENTRNMSQSIMDSFDQAAKDVSGAGRATSLVKTPRSAMALHQAMQPTFKDLEGTVRQAAMDNTFKNITPDAADTDADRATKRAALSDYLKSKLSAPTARAYGVDLSKYNSTAPYKGGGQSAATSDKQQSNYRASGSAVSGDEVAQYAMKHGLKLSDAQNYLRSQGYAINR